MTDASDNKCHCESEEGFGGPVFEPRLYIQRYYFVQQQLIKHKVSSVVDFGSAECKISRFLVRVPTMEKIAMVDIDQSLLKAFKHVIRPQAYDYLDRREGPLSLKILCGSVTEADKTVVDFDAVTMVEVIEHLHMDILNAARDNVFGRMQPRIVILTTPNAEFNVLFPGFSGFRHYDHKFEWTREEFQEWCSSITEQYPYTVEYEGIGDPPMDHTDVGHCSQAAIFVRKSEIPKDSKINCVSDTYTLVAESIYPHKKESGLTEEETMLMELNYLLRQHSLATSLKHKIYQAGTNHVTNDNQSYSTIHAVSKENSGSSHTDKHTNNMGTNHRDLQCEQDSSQFKTQAVSYKNVAFQNSTCLGEKSNDYDSLGFKCECNVQTDDVAGNFVESRHCNCKINSCNNEIDTGVRIIETNEVKRDETREHQCTSGRTTNINDKYVNIANSDTVPCKHKKSDKRDFEKISNPAFEKMSDIDVKYSNIEGSDTVSFRQIQSDKLYNEKGLKPGFPKKIDIEESDIVCFNQTESEEDNLDDENDGFVMVPVTDLLKYKRISSKFDIEQLRTFLREHNYTLSNDLSCVVYSLESEDLQSDIEEEEEVGEEQIDDNLEDNYETNRTVSFDDIETEYWD